MVELALEGSDWLMLDKWESEQPEYVLTQYVIKHVHDEVVKHVKSDVQVFLACGADLFESLKKADVWSEEDVIRILVDFTKHFPLTLLSLLFFSWNQIHGLFKYGGLVVVERGTNANDVAKVVDEHDLLYTYRVSSSYSVNFLYSLFEPKKKSLQSKIHVVRQDIVNDTSSSRIRKLIMRGRSIKYLLPDSVVQYIQDNSLYVDKTLEKQVSIFGNY